MELVVGMEIRYQRAKEMQVHFRMVNLQSSLVKNSEWTPGKKGCQDFNGVTPDNSSPQKSAWYMSAKESPGTALPVMATKIQASTGDLAQARSAAQKKPLSQPITEKVSGGWFAAYGLVLH